MTDANRQLDDDLRRVPLPENLRAALTPEALFADAGIDRLLEAVTVPPGLADRVRAAARAADAPARNGVVDLTRFTAGRGEPAPLSRPAAGVGARQTHGGLRMVREAGWVAAALGLAFVLATAGIQLSRWLEGPGASGQFAAAGGGRGANDGGARPTPRTDLGLDAGPGSLATQDQADNGVAAGGDDRVQRGSPERAVASVAPTTQRATAPDSSILDRQLPASAESPAPEPLRVRGAVPMGDATAMKVVELPRDARR
jgi:hypothetical protein